MAEAQETSDQNNNETVHTAREYQVELLDMAIDKNTIVCLGTGTGKTFISIKLIEHLARKDNIYKPFSKGGKRTFFLVNSVPLVFQQAEAIKRHTDLNVGYFCGEMGVDFWSSEVWLKHFETNQVLVMTHQIFHDLLHHAKLHFNRANLVILDECHHARKSHPFKRIMDLFSDTNANVEQHWPRVLGLTASVVGQKVKPTQIPRKVDELEKTMRCRCATARDPNVVEKYGAKPREGFKKFSISRPKHPISDSMESEMLSILKSLKKFLDEVKIVIHFDGREVLLQKEISCAQSAVRECLSAMDSIGLWGVYQVSKLLVVDFEKRIKKILGTLPCNTKLICSFSEATVTALRQICGIYDKFVSAYDLGDDVPGEFLKPKVLKLLELFEGSTENICAIVFVQRRYAARVVSTLLNKVSEVTSGYVTGNSLNPTAGAEESSMNFNKQRLTLKKFKKGGFNVLVGTSVVEEGVDIPKCNLVVMFDFPQNYRAYVQSKGRGRAKDARYVLLVPENEYGELKEDLLMYQSVDDYLTDLCREERSLPSVEDCLSEMNVDPVPPYYTAKGAKVDMGSAIALLERYCSKLPCDRFTTLHPKFTYTDVDNQYQCTVQMPRNCPVTGLIIGEALENKEDAKRAVALKVCRMLHEDFEELDDHLLPCQTDSSDSECSDVDETDAAGKKAKTGTKKRRRPHKIKGNVNLDKGLDGETAYVYALKMEVEDVYTSKKAQVEKGLWDRKDCLLGLVTKNELPSQALESFTLYNHFAKILVTVRLCKTVSNLTAAQLLLFDWFHRFVFAEVLRFGRTAELLPCSRIVLLSSTALRISPNSHTNKRSYSPEIIDIDHREMAVMRRRAEDWTPEPSLAREDWSDTMVVTNYREHVQTYFVVDVDCGLSPLSEFPDQTKARCFKSYYKLKYDLDIIDEHQPLLKVMRCSRKIDFRSDRAVSSSSERYDGERLVPELCTSLPYSQSLYLRATALPTLCYRLRSLLDLYEFRSRVEKDIGLDASPDTDNSEKKPRFRDSLSCNGHTSSDSSTDEEDGTPPSLLDTLFYSSRTRVPLFALLEASTCAGSDDMYNLERLEMLGDSFLKMAVSVHVYWHEAHKDEGRLTKHRTKQVSNKNLFKLAVDKEITGFIKHSKFDRNTWRPPGFEPIREQEIPDKSAADSVEALIGAYLTHCGYITTLHFMDWLGLKVLCEEAAASFNGSRFANYPRPCFAVPHSEDERRYNYIVEEQVRGMDKLERDIGYVFENKALLLEAFTHPSFTDQTITGSYQRLEFLGDAILDFLVTQHIYSRSGEKLTPGKLTTLRSALVNNNIFATIAVKYKYHTYLKEYSPVLFNVIGAFVTSCEELGGEVNPNPYIIPSLNEEGESECFEAPKPLGDVFESVAGAVFLDSGLDLRTVWKVYYPMLKKYIDAYSEDVPMNPVQEVSHFDNDLEFSCASIKEDGRVSCTLTFSDEKAKKIGQKEFIGEGRNKRNAKLCAAYAALPKIQKIEN